MAISTTSTINDYIMNSAIMPSYLAAAFMNTEMQQFLWDFGLIPAGANTATLPRFDSLVTIADDGASVATAYNGTEGSDVTSSTVTSSTVTATLTEYVCRIDLTDNITEDSIDGIDLINNVVAIASQVIMAAKEDDAIARLAGLDNNVGSSGSDLTLAIAYSAFTGTRRRGFHAPDGMVFFFDPEQWDNIETAMLATSTSTAVYPQSINNLLGVDRTANNGMGNGHVGFVRGYPAYESQFTDTANTGADVVGGCFIPASPANNAMGHTTFGKVGKRPFRIEPQRDASMRATEMVFSERSGSVELNGGAGASITTDAP